MWSRKLAAASAPPIDTWPAAIIGDEFPGRREVFEAKKTAIKLYFAMASVLEIERQTGVQARKLAAMARKCLLPADDGNILGFRALIPFARIGDYTRTAPPTAKYPQAQGGWSGALQQLLTAHPDIEKSLVLHIRQDAKLQSVPEYKLRPRDLHRIFIRLLRERKVPKTEWPFNTKYLGKRSIETYMRAVLDRNFSRTVQSRESQEARAHLATGTGTSAFLQYTEPYAAVEIDAYKIESHLTVAFRTPEGTETDVLLERIWLIAAVDRYSSAILSYYVVYRTEVNADDVLRVIRLALTQRWAPMQLTVPGLKYEPNTGLPSGVISGAFGIAWTSTLFDGALVHLSRAVHDRARRTLGCAINWGPVAHFERRPNVERTFNQIARDLFKRLPSTTGSHPKNGRADNAEEKAILHRIRATETEQVLDVTIAQHNALPSEGNSYLSPLEVIRYFLENPDVAFMARTLPETSFEYAKTFAVQEFATVRGGHKTGRRPYVQIDRVHYTNPVLANAGQLVDMILTVKIDEEDMRHVRAFLPNGGELGILKAHGKWGVTKHTRRTRKAINSLLSKRVLVISQFDDPVQIYMQHLARSREKKRESITPKHATKIAQLAKESGTPLVMPLLRENPSKPIDSKPAPSSSAALPSLLPSSSSFFNRVKNRR